VILFGEGPLLRTLAEFSAHYHGERNHQAKGKLLFPEVSDEPEQLGHTLNAANSSKAYSSTIARIAALHELLDLTGLRLP